MIYHSYEYVNCYFFVFFLSQITMIRFYSTQILPVNYIDEIRINVYDKSNN